jgi:hypothetical protein
MGKSVKNNFEQRFTQRQTENCNSLGKLHLITNTYSSMHRRIRCQIDGIIATRFAEHIYAFVLTSGEQPARIAVRKCARPHGRQRFGARDIRPTVQYLQSFLTIAHIVNTTRAVG